MKKCFLLQISAFALLLAGCDMGTQSTRRFHLPQGNAENGRAAFVALKCTTCHTVDGVDLPKPTVASDAVVVLGGEVATLRTYGDLLTSIIHPGEALSEKMRLPRDQRPTKSPMPVVNDTMTVTQMIDLVTFLQPHYKMLPPPYEWYFPM